MAEDIYKKAEKIHREEGDAVQGDKILVYCRKKDKWNKIRGSEAHHYFHTKIRMNALAVIDKTFKNLQKA